MKITINRPVEYDARILLVKADVRYWDDASINGVVDTEGSLIPCRDGDLWIFAIELDTGKIIRWEQGKEADVHFKICDAGVYALLDDAGDSIIEKDGYVPDMLCPKSAGYGDYIIMDIDKEGFIQNWKADLSYFSDDEE